MSSCDDVGDICNLGSLTCPVAFPENPIQSNNFSRKNHNDDDDDEDDMCLIDDESFLTYDEKKKKVISLCVSVIQLPPQHFTFLSNQINFGFVPWQSCDAMSETSYSEDENDLTESKIKSFLDEKVTTTHTQIFHISISRVCNS